MRPLHRPIQLPLLVLLLIWLKLLLELVRFLLNYMLYVWLVEMQSSCSRVAGGEHIGVWRQRSPIIRKRQIAHDRLHHRFRVRARHVHGEDGVGSGLTRFRAHLEMIR